MLGVVARWKVGAAVAFAGRVGEWKPAPAVGSSLGFWIER